MGEEGAQGGAVEGAEELGGDECSELAAGAEPGEGALEEEGGEVGLGAEVCGDALSGGVGPEGGGGGLVVLVEGLAGGGVDVFGADPGRVGDDEVEAAAGEGGGEAGGPGEL